MSYNAVLTDRKDEQVLPITTAENVFYSGSKTVKQAIDDIIAGNFPSDGFNGRLTRNRDNVSSPYSLGTNVTATPQG